jgi:hypothetical protein
VDSKGKVISAPNLTPHFEGVWGVELHIFLTFALDGDERSASRPVALPPGKEPAAVIRKKAGWASEPVW